MFKKRKVVMLPTNERSQIWIGTPALGLRHDQPGSAPFIKYFHLYFLSDDEEIKDVDWIYRRKDGYETIQKATLPLNLTSVNKKIIATTDKSLTTNSIYGIDSFDASIFSGSGKSQMVKLPQMFNLPQPSHSFIEKFVEEYNKGNIITEVRVEYIDEGEEDWFGDDYNGEPVWNEKIVLKVNPKDNTITIRKMKDSWNREEVIKLINKISEEVDFESATQKTIDKWIEENL